MTEAQLGSNFVPASKVHDERRSDERLSRNLVLNLLRKLSVGALTVEEGGRRYDFGESAATASISATIIVHDSAMYRDVLLRGSIGAGESYMQGYWTSPELTQVVRVLVLNMHLLDDMDGRAITPRKIFTALSKFSFKVYHALRANSRTGSRKNIAAHYDLGNDFYKLFLDPSMMYSAAIFPQPESSLHEASLYKIDRICKKLQLESGDHLLEIGTGWGGLAIHAARHYGCRVTTTTISQEQFSYAQASVAAAGLSDRVEVLLRDYRDLDGRYDKLVSVEMIEAVGHQYYRQYFEKCASLLKADGQMLIQVITIADQRYEAAHRSVDFIQRYIFPGGSLPSISVIAQTVARHTDLTISGIEEITQHYARTLRAWRQRFNAQLEQVRQLGYDERFIRMWEFYLCYCEGGFLERSIGTHQLVFAKPGCRIEPQLGLL
jgi:cyclopropane-fatty-acyl-phospholipid synthase